MTMDCLFVFSLLLFFAVSTLSLPLLDSGDIKEVTGVFIYPEPPQDIFNASAAKDACRSQNAALATKAQVERALQHGLETCKYGWIDEQIAVIPRILVKDKCGQGKTGLVVWKAALTKRFAAFCFQVSDLKQTQTMTTDSVLSLTTTLPAQVHASTAMTPPVTTKMKPPASIPSTAPPGWKLQAPVTSNSPPTLTSKPSTAATSSSISPISPPTLASKPPTAATSSSISPTSPPTLASKPPTAATSSSISPTSPPTLASKPPTTATSSSISPTSPTRTSASSTTAPPLLSRSPLTSIPARFSSSSSLTILSSTSLFTPSPSPPVSRDHARGSTLQTVSSADTSLGGVPKALIVLAVILLLMAAAGAVWYFKLPSLTHLRREKPGHNLRKKQVLPPWSRRQQKDDTETEMWKHADSDLDLHGNQEVEEEADKKFSDDITACLNSDNKINSS